MMQDLLTVVLGASALVVFFIVVLFLGLGMEFVNDLRSVSADVIATVKDIRARRRADRAWDEYTRR